MRIEVLRPEQIPQVTELIRSSVRELQTGEYTAAQREAALQTVFTVDSRLVADGTYLGAYSVDGSLVGCGGWSFRKTLYGGDAQLERIVEDRMDPAVDAAKIRAIFVHPAYAKRGIGYQLLTAAEDAARAAGFTRFEMGSTLTGLALYVRCGYREMSRFQVPVGSGETLEIVRMVKLDRPDPITTAGAR